MARSAISRSCARTRPRSRGFYRRNFGMDEAGRSADGDVTLTDGGFNLTLFRHRPALREPRMEHGLHHIGIAVDDVDAVVARYRARYPRGTVIAESGDLQHGQARIYDPECNPVTLSQTNFGLGRRGAARAAHRASGAQRARHRGDPRFLPRRVRLPRVVRGPQGIAQAPRLSQQARRRRPLQRRDPGVLQRRGRPRGALRHRAFRLPGAGLQGSWPSRCRRAARPSRRGPAHRTQSEIRMRDPEGNGCDLSQRGWEVDTDKWVRAA